MADVRRLIARRAETPAAGSDGGRGTGRVPAELLSEQVQRLAVFSAVAAAVWTFGLFMDAAVLPAATGSGVPNWRAMLIEAAAAASALGMYLYVHYAGHDDETKITAGLGFMLLNAVGIAGLNSWAMPPFGREDLHISWATILILVYSMIAPGSPRRLLVASLAAASMDPLAFGLVWLAGAPTPPALSVVVMSWPNYACAVIAMLPSRVLQRIGRRLREAQEMGSYQLVERLGEGGMGEVWRAQHRLLARDAAIKLIRPEVLGARTEAEARIVRRRFEREARATAALSSPHTIQVFDFGMAQDDTFYYVMELLHGRDAESLVREFGPVPANRAVHLLRQVCHSLADAHARGLVHRDIKPANVYICRMGLEYDFVKVLDFGLVKTHGRGGHLDTLATIDQTTTGTPAYMAPETILGDAEVDRRADVYALGCVAYFLLTGQLVFEGDTSMKVLMQHVHAQPLPPSARTELPIPPQLDALVLSCLEKDPARRPQSARELFELACGCRAATDWTQDMAGRWWEAHLPDLSRPLTMPGAPPLVPRAAATL